MTAERRVILQMKKNTEDPSGDQDMRSHADVGRADMFEEKV